MMTREDWLTRFGALHATNGYARPPWAIYEQFLKVVDTPGPIVELACGNGLLLRFLFDLSGLVLEPYGLDINPVAVAEAKAVVFPDRKDCFVLADLRDGIPFGRDFATVLTNPLNADQGYYEQVGGKVQRLHDPGAVRSYVVRCWRSVAPGGRLVLWCYDGHVQELANGFKTFVSAIESADLAFRTVPSGPVRFWISDRRTGTVATAAPRDTIDQSGNNARLGL